MIFFKIILLFLQQKKFFNKITQNFIKSFTLYANWCWWPLPFAPLTRVLRNRHCGSVPWKACSFSGVCACVYPYHFEAALLSRSRSAVGLQPQQTALGNNTHVLQVISPIRSRHYGAKLTAKDLLSCTMALLCVWPLLWDFQIHICLIIRRRWELFNSFDYFNDFFFVI